MIVRQPHRVRCGRSSVAEARQPDEEHDVNILMVTNLRSGLGDPGLYDFARELGEHGVEVTLRFLSEGSDLSHLLRDATTYDRVVAAGGDGTVSAIAYALRGTGVPVLAYPAGTANIIARNLKLPLEPAALAQAVIAGLTVAIDIGEFSVEDADGGVSRVGGFAIAAGAGFDASIMDAAQSLKATLGEGAYIIGALQNIAPTVSEFTLELDGTTVRTEGIAVLIVNLARIQFDLAVAHGSDAQDGLFEVVVLKTRTAAGLLPTVWAALLDRLQSHPARPGLEIHSASSVRIVADPPLPIEYDGEVLAGTTPLAARVLPRAATFIVSEEAPLPRDEFGADGTA